MDLKQIPQAVSIWELLIKSDDPEVAGVASDTLQKVLQPLLEKIDSLCTLHSWQRKNLPGPSTQPTDNFTLAVLYEVIATRAANRADLSLALIDAVLEHGWDTPWLHDNRARALIDQGLRDEACTIWERLQHHDDPTVAAEARTMLHQYEPHRISHPIRDRVEALERAGQTEEAVLEIVGGLAISPSDATLWSLLEERQSGTSAKGNRPVDKQLSKTDTRLSAEETLLAYFEAKLARAHGK